MGQSRNVTIMNRIKKALDELSTARAKLRVLNFVKEELEEEASEEPEEAQE